MKLELETAKAQLQPESHSGQQSTLRGIKVVFKDFERLAIASMTESMEAIK
jgi:hypothetical protein